MIKKQYYPGLAVVLGALGFFLRRWQLSSCFDEKDLPIPGLAVPLLAALTVGSALLFLVLVFPFKGEKSWTGALGEAPLPLLKLGALGCLLAAASYIAEHGLKDFSSSVFQYTNVLLPVLLLLGAFGAAIGCWHLSNSGHPQPAIAMLPGFCSCFWVVNAYHTYANDPVVLDFAWFLLAVAASTLAWYEIAAFPLDRGCSRRALFFSLMAIMLCLSCLADSELSYDRILLIVQVICFVALSARMAGHMEFAGWGTPMKRHSGETAEHE